MRITDSRIKSDVLGANNVSVWYCGAGVRSNIYEFAVKCPIRCFDENSSRKAIGADIAAETINSAAGDGAFITIMRQHPCYRSKSRLDELESRTFRITGARSEGDFAVIECEYQYRQTDPQRDADIISNASFICQLRKFRGLYFLDIIEKV